MKIPENRIIVLDIAGSRAVVQCHQQSSARKLIELGFSQDQEYWVRAIRDDAERKLLVNELIRFDALFSEGRDWSPAELVGLYREQGKVLHSYETIYWKNQLEYVIVKHVL